MPLSFDEALRTKCEHGVPKIIVCPKCEPDKYVLSPEEIERIKKRFPEFVVEERQDV